MAAGVHYARYVSLCNVGGRVEETESIFTGGDVAELASPRPPEKHSYSKWQNFRTAYSACLEYEQIGWPEPYSSL
jgi:hypothetical protein